MAPTNRSESDKNANVVRLNRMERVLERRVGSIRLFQTGLVAPHLRMVAHDFAAGTLIRSNMGGVRMERARGALNGRFRESVFLNLQGNGRVNCQEATEEFSAGKGDIVLTDPSIESSLWADERASFVSLSIPRQEVTAIFAGGADPFRCVIDGANGLGRLISSLLQTFITTIPSLDEDSAVIGRDLILRLLEAAIAQHRMRGNDKDEILITKMRRWLIGRIANGPISVADWAGAFALSQRSLYRLFERRGVTPEKWLLTERLELARRRLDQPDASVTNVAFASGFKNLSHFSRSFRNIYGVPPGAYRRRPHEL